MKILICYYSGSGNTKLVCHYFVKKIKEMEFTLFNVVKDGIPEISGYDAIGFATFTDFWGPPQLMLEFIEKVKPLKKPAFFITTYGFIAGRTPLVMKRALEKRGFDVFAGHSLHTPENYPPMIVRGMGNENAPSESELTAFNTFTFAVSAELREYSAGRRPVKNVLNIKFWHYIFPMLSRAKATKDMGAKYVDEKLCTKCGICIQGCPYVAIVLDPLPVFDMKKCGGCWFCYNHCQTKAIYTKKFRNIGHYPAPNKELRKKLSL